MTDQSRLDELARETTAIMLASASRTGVIVRELESAAETSAAAELLACVWDVAAGRNLVDPNLMTAMSHAGNYVAGAYIENELVGACVGFFSEPLGVALHSHIAGVAPSFAGHGIGTALKLHQKAWCLRRGIVEVTWTFDPLVAKNAYFNVHRLAARPTEYLTDFYGEMQDAFNTNLPTDRMLVRWDLAPSNLAQTQATAQPRVLELGLDGTPQRLDRLEEAGFTHCHVYIPPDIDGLKETDLALARRWRESLRMHLMSLLFAGWVITDFSKDGYYILERNLNENHRGQAS